VNVAPIFLVAISSLATSTYITTHTSMTAYTGHKPSGFTYQWSLCLSGNTSETLREAKEHKIWQRSKLALINANGMATTGQHKSRPHASIRCNLCVAPCDMEERTTLQTKPVHQPSSTLHTTRSMQAWHPAGHLHEKHSPVWRGH